MAAIYAIVSLWRGCGTILLLARFSVTVSRRMLLRDCVIIGGGPAGLTAAIYMSRFHLNIAVIDAGKSRALWIPETHNHAGFPDGIAGSELLARMRDQAVKYGTKCIQGRVSRISREGNDAPFTLEYGHGKIDTLNILMATRVVNRRPAIHEDLHTRALA